MIIRKINQGEFGGDKFPRFMEVIRNSAFRIPHSELSLHRSCYNALDNVLLTKQIENNYRQN